MMFYQINNRPIFFVFFFFFYVLFFFLSVAAAFVMAAEYDSVKFNLNLINVEEISYKICSHLEFFPF